MPNAGVPDILTKGPELPGSTKIQQPAETDRFKQGITDRYAQETQLNVGSLAQVLNKHLHATDMYCY